MVGPDPSSMHSFLAYRQNECLVIGHRFLMFFQFVSLQLQSHNLRAQLLSGNYALCIYFFLLSLSQLFFPVLHVLRKSQPLRNIESPGILDQHSILKNKKPAKGFFLIHLFHLVAVVQRLPLLWAGLFLFDRFVL